MVKCFQTKTNTDRRKLLCIIILQSLYMYHFESGGVEKMNSKEIKIKLKNIKPILEKKYKVKSIGVFGSFARNEANENSDIDILVEFYDDIGWEFIDLKRFLEKKLDRKVDLVTKGALKPKLEEDILKEVIYQ